MEGTAIKLFGAQNLSRKEGLMNISQERAAMFNNNTYQPPIRRVYDYAIKTNNSALVRKIWALKSPDRSDFNALFVGNILNYTPREEVLNLLAEVKELI